MKKWLFSVCAATLLLGASQVMAQEKTKPMPPKDGAQMEMPMKVQHHRAKRTDKMAEELGLSAEQQEQAKMIRKQGREKVAPLMQDMRKIREKMDKLREENMKEFEKILTPEQKVKFEKIKAEKKAKFEEMKAKRKHAPKHEQKD